MLEYPSESNSSGQEHVDFSRSIGDYTGHKYGLTCEPDITFMNLMDFDEIIILATSGLWRYMTDQNVASIA